MPVALYKKCVSAVSVSMLALCMVLLVASQARAELWRPMVDNYPRTAYGNGAQTWQIAPAAGGFTFFANQRGLLMHDGSTWEVLRLPNGHDVRSVMVDTLQHRVYVGGINEFGYFSPADNGSLVYTSLVDADPTGTLAHCGNVWGIHSNPSAIYICADQNVMRLRDGNITLLDFHDRIDFSTMVGDVLYVANNQGLYVLMGDSFMRMHGTDRPARERIRGVWMDSGELRVATMQGLYACDGFSANPIATAADAYLRDNKVFCVARAGERMAFGTVQGGVVVIDETTGGVMYFTEDTGLQDNTVLSLCFTPDGDLWAGLDRGIDRVELSSPFSLLRQGSRAIGAGYAAALHGNKMYLGTNRGLFVVPRDSRSVEDIEYVAGSTGQVWSLIEIDDELYCAHDRGFYHVSPHGLEPAVSLPGVWTAVAIPGRKDYYWIGTYNGLWVCRNDRGAWTVVNRVDGMDDSCRDFIGEGASGLWLSNSDNIAFIELDDSLQRVVRRTILGRDEGLPPQARALLAHVDGRLVAATSAGLYCPDSERKSMLPDTILEPRLLGSGAYTLLKGLRQGIVARDSKRIALHYRCGRQVHCALPTAHIQPVEGFENVTLLPDSTVVIPNERGFALFNPRRVSHATTAAAARPLISSVKVIQESDSLLYRANFANRRESIVVGHGNNSLRVLLAGPYNFDDIYYMCRLDGRVLSTKADANELELINLSAGRHRLQVEAYSATGEPVGADEIVISVNPAWYARTGAKVLWVVLVLMLMGLLWWLELLRVRRREDSSLKAKDLEMKQMEEEFATQKALRDEQIVQLEKEKLEYELKHKSQEIANAMINVMRKNEILRDIRRNIAEVAQGLTGKDSRQARSQLMEITASIDSNITADDVLQRSEKEFDLIHNDFMSRLRETYPDLSQNERMLCAYLRMNLSTKEIAPLFNISVRGVETIRYRLRKKFGLQRDVSLSDFINNF